MPTEKERRERGGVIVTNLERIKTFTGLTMNELLKMWEMDVMCSTAGRVEPNPKPAHCGRGR